MNLLNSIYHQILSGCLLFTLGLGMTSPLAAVRIAGYSQEKDLKESVLFRYERRTLPPDIGSVLPAQLLAATANDDDIRYPDGSANIETISDLTPGRKYWVQVDGSDAEIYGEFTLNLTSSLNVLAGQTEAGRSHLHIYPNPTQGLFTLKIPAAGRTGRIEVMDGTGRRVYAAELEHIRTGDTRQVDLSQADGGIYIVRLMVDGTAFHAILVRE